MRLVAALVLVAFPFVVAAELVQLKLFHRLFHPAAGTTPYTHRATLLIDEHNAISVQLAPSFADDLITFGDVLRSVGKEAHLALYQVALERSGDKTEAEWDISSVKACHLLQASSESIHLHTLDPHNPNPYALDYFIAPIPHDGACQTGKYKGTAQVLVDTNPVHAFANNIHRLNTTVTFRGSTFPPL
ncbi:hypothetical protein BDZ94DRAFT_492688 [Collybia nuda]|uniref:Uncharacterized protein n=1 Tax=Collybia nuda TaxID=64659 RepID=A0A9P6CFW3_9AGAR|nr:hypothetical protein BDZ94DRAFT_492688 [Collybia nuda]